MNYTSYRQKMADSGQTADQWRKEADTWFDGTPESVDRRLALCNLLLARSQEAVAKEGMAGKHLGAIEDLQASAAHLRGLRRHLLTAGADTETPEIDPYTQSYGEYVKGPAIDDPKGGQAFQRVHPDIDKALQRRFDGGGPGVWDPDKPGGILHDVNNWWDGPREVTHLGGGELEYKCPYTGNTDRFNSRGYYDQEGNLVPVNGREAGRHDNPSAPSDEESLANYEHVKPKPGDILGGGGRAGYHPDESYIRGEELRGHPDHLSSQDRRYVELESAKFTAANRGLPKDELLIRARNQAELDTSTLSVARSRAVTAAFVSRVAQTYRPTPRTRVASAPVPQGPDEALFM